MKKILLIALTLAFTSSCSSKTKNRLGLTETVPDEYQVTSNKPLEVPPFYKPNK